MNENLKSRLNLCVLFTCLIMLASCTATVESESNRYAAKLAKLEFLKSSMPKYAPIIEDHIEELKNKKVEVDQITDEKEKLTRMGELNRNALLGGVSSFYELESTISEVQRSINFLNRRKSGDVNAIVIDQIRNTENLISEVKRDYSNRNNQLSDYDQASDEVLRYVRLLRDANIPLAKTEKSLKELDKKKNKNKTKDKKKAKKSNNS